MVTWLRSFVRALLWDEAKAQQYLTAFCAFFGWVLVHGGAFPVPGYGEVVLPGLVRFYSLGPWFIVFAFFLGAGSVNALWSASATATRKKNESTPPPDPQP